MIQHWLTYAISSNKSRGPDFLYFNIPYFGFPEKKKKKKKKKNKYLHIIVQVHDDRNKS